MDLFHAQPLFIGTYEKATDFPLGFDSYIPTQLKLSAIPAKGTNKAEGVVIKPFKVVLMMEAAKGPNVRAILKRKIPEFSEDKR